MLSGFTLIYLYKQNLEVLDLNFPPFEQCNYIYG